MKSVKKFALLTPKIIFICITILFLFQVLGLLNPENLESNIASEFHKIIFTVFMLVVSTYKTDSRKILLLGIITIVSISLCLDFRAEYHFGIIYQYAVVYLFALPLSEYLNDVKRNVYLKWFAILYTCSSFFNLLGCYLLLFGYKTDILPSRFSFYKTRLSSITHPNVTAIYFAISIGMLVFLFFGIRNKVARATFLVLVCVYFPLLWLTNSRTNALLMIFYLVAMFFYVYLRRVRSINTKKIITLLLSLCAFAIVLILLYSVIFSNHRNAVLEETGTNMDLQMSFWKSLVGFNGRTDIWKSTLDVVFSERKNFWFGTGKTLEAWHAHNSWMQCFLNFGVFGFVFATYFTIRGIKAAVSILFLNWKKTSMAQKSVALLMAVLLVANTMEPYIFVNLSMNINFVFFLLLGYTLMWEKELKGKIISGGKITNEKI